MLPYRVIFTKRGTSFALNFVPVKLVALNFVPTKPVFQDSLHTPHRNFYPYPPPSDVFFLSRSSPLRCFASQALAKKAAKCRAVPRKTDSFCTEAVRLQMSGTRAYAANFLIYPRERCHKEHSGQTRRQIPAVRFQAHFLVYHSPPLYNTGFISLSSVEIMHRATQFCYFVFHLVNNHSEQVVPQQRVTCSIALGF